MQPDPSEYSDLEPETCATCDKTVLRGEAAVIYPEDDGPPVFLHEGVCHIAFTAG